MVSKSKATHPRKQQDAGGARSQASTFLRIWSPPGRFGTSQAVLRCFGVSVQCATRVEENEEDPYPTLLKDLKGIYCTQMCTS